MKKMTYLSLLFAICTLFLQPAYAQSLKPHHANAFGEKACQTCHDNSSAFTTPDEKTCIACHGEMSQIKTKPNKNNKYPHNSPHYDDLISCTVCHSEHSQSKALCTDCHVTTEFINLK